MDTYQNSPRIVVLVTAVAAALSSAHATANEYRVSRYSEFSTSSSEAQRDPLLSPVQTGTSDELILIGDMVDWLLKPSGYRLASASSGVPERGMLLALPLPDVHRSLEGLPVRTALQTLAGPAFRLVEDPVHRLISFEQCGVTREGR
jgi:type IV pili sensor histidine kinase/response regulator